MTHPSPKPDTTPHLTAEMARRNANLERDLGASLLQFAAANWLFVALMVLIAVFSSLQGSFLSLGNWLNVTDTAVAITLVACVQAILIISGGIDLSQGAVMGLSGTTAAVVMKDYFGGYASTQGLTATVVGIAIALMIGAGIGFLNGVIIAKSRLNPFIITLGTSLVCVGFANLENNGQDITDIPPQVGAIGSTYIGGVVSVPVVVATLVVVFLAVMLNRTRFGKYSFVIGDSREAAVRAGIRVDRHMIIVYTMSSLISSLAGVLVMARLASASPVAGGDLIFNSITAAVIGGASLSGGRGGIGRTVIGAFLISVLLIGLIISNVQPFWQQIAVGLVLVAAVFIDEKGQVRRSVGGRFWVMRTKKT